MAVPGREAGWSRGCPEVRRGEIHAVVILIAITTDVYRRPRASTRRARASLGSDAAFLSAVARCYRRTADRALFGNCAAAGGRN